MLLSTNASRMGRTAAEDRSGAQGERAVSDRHPVTDGSGSAQGRRGARTRGKGPREGAVALRFRVLSACRVARPTVPGDRPDRGSVPIRGVSAPGMVRACRDADPRPVVILRPAPQRVERIFTPAALERLHRDYEVVDLEDVADGASRSTPRCPGRSRSSASRTCRPTRLDRAPDLRAVMNVEGNFFPNVDYEACFRNGVHVLGCGPAYAQAVAEYALGLAIDLARGISREDRAFRAGRERYVAGGQRGRDPAARTRRIGLVGYGNLGRALHRLLRPVRRHDPGLRPVAPGRRRCARPGSSRRRSRRSSRRATSCSCWPRSPPRASACSAPPSSTCCRAGARLVLVSRAAVVDLDALLDRVAAGRLLAAIDVWPEEPVAAGRSGARPGRPRPVGAPRRRDPGGVPRDRRDGPRRPRPDPRRAAAGPDAAGGPRARHAVPQPARDLDAA